ncbi:asparaginase [Kroppenstedtia eburnea]|uniref:asparaginase n=1 Tax=Kroppenstedtia eburnea TaxID=714067 RepID=UPI00362E1656
MRRITIITTGGTIAMAEDERTGDVRPLGSEGLQRVLPLLSRYGVQVKMDHFCNLPSPHITPQWMHRIGQRVIHHLSRPDVDGVVVTHGTDTLEETAYYLDLTLPGDLPVILTGAMRSQNELGADGPLNLVNAVRVASHPKARGKGTLVVFNDEIHAARWVTKTHTSNVATFQSPSQGPVGTITKKDILFHQSLSRGRVFPHLPPVEGVYLVKAAAGTDDLLIQAALQAQARGLVVEALGQGNLPPAMLPGLRKVVGSGIPTVLVSRCHHGFVEDTYGYDGGGKQLKEWGIIFANGLNGQKARIQLMAALHVSRDPARLQTFFKEYPNG